MPKSKDPTACIRHLKWKPCLGPWQSHDPEACYMTRNVLAVDIVRQVHMGTLTSKVAHQMLEKHRSEIKPRKLTNEGGWVVE